MFVGGPGTIDCTLPKTLLFSSDGTALKCKAARIVPSGKGSFPSRYALIAVSLPKTAPRLLRLPSSWAEEIHFQSRYTAGILLTKIGGEFLSACPNAGTMW